MKNRVRESINFPLDWENETEIKYIRHQLDVIENLGATHVLIEIDDDYEGSYYFKIYPIYIRNETDEEYSKRILEENKKAELIKQLELKQLEYLKNKYDNT